METTRQTITKATLLREAKTSLERAVAKSAPGRGEGYSTASWLSDLLCHGCQSGMIGGLVYYHDTTAFYRRHREEIGGLLKSALEDIGGGPAGLFGDKWDVDDPLALEVFNQNLLAWFGFEESARNLAFRVGLEY